MKVTLLYSKYLTDPTGASAVMRFLKQGQQLFLNNDVEINFFTRDYILPQRNHIVKANKGINKLSLKDRIMDILRKQSKTHPLLALIHKYIRSDRAAKILVEKYRLAEPDDDIVFMHELETCYRYLRSRKKADTKKIVLVLHENGKTHNMTLIEYPSLSKPYFYNRLIKKSDYVFKNIDRLGFVSEMSMKAFIENNPNFPKEKLFFNLNGIPALDNILPRKYGNKIINLCCVGTINERKGQRHIVEAVNNLSEKEREKIHITLVGDGEIKNELYQYCSNHNLTSIISFLGKRDDIVDILSKNDIFILPSHNEGLPISILEAMRQGLPIVSTKVGGIPEMIEDKVTGLFITPTTDSLTIFLKNISSFNWTKMGEQSKELYERKFSLMSMVNKYSDVFSNVIKD